MIHGEFCASVLVGDNLESLRKLADRSINCCVTSPPYFGLRDYGVDGQIGLEETPEAFVARLVEVFREVRRVLTDDGTLWVNIGDSYARNPAKGQHKPGAPGAGKNGYVVEQGGGRASSTYGPQSDRRTEGSSDGGVRRADRPDRRNAGGVKEKDLIGIPWMLAFALRADGWYLRQDIIWHKPNPMPESVRDRCTKAHEYVFLLSKSPSYYYDHEAIKEASTSAPPGNRTNRAATEYENGDEKHRTKAGLSDYAARARARAEVGQPETRNKRSVWTVAPRPYAGAHFAVYPPELIEPCILAGCPPGGVVLDPFGGSGTTAGAALANGRHAIMCELNPEYAALMPDRVATIVARGLRLAA